MTQTQNSSPTLSHPADPEAPQGVLELVLFRTKEGIDRASFERHAEASQQGIADLPGFESRQLWQSPEGTWLDLVRWKDLQSARKAAEIVMTLECCQAFFAGIDPESIQMLHFSGKRQWPAPQPASWADFQGLEFGTFRLQAGVDEAQLLAASQQAVDQVLRHQKGFLAHFLLKGKEQEYVDMALADSQTAAETICGLWGQFPETRKLMDLVQKGSEKLSFYQRIQ
ncbi:MAG: hypothetical protein DWQ01_15865 [Planctomycetota bacterium]|nr:MAG: hypothetical protein DWQ01_15865 [Planctomycetota bacterium]